MAVVDQAGTTMATSASDTTGIAVRRSRHPLARTHSMTPATIATMMNPRPVDPTHDTTSAKGLSDWLSAALPHGNPPYGIDPVAASRTIQRPAMSRGSPMRRTHFDVVARGTQRYARVMSTAPPATNADSRIESASHGIGPR